MTYRVALRLCGNHHDARDPAQEALIVASASNLDRFQGSIRPLRAWLYRIVARQALSDDQPRPRRPTPWTCSRTWPTRRGTRGSDQSATSPSTRSPTPLAALPFPQRAVVVLHHFEGLSYTDVAAVTGSHRPGGP